MILNYRKNKGITLIALVITINEIKNFDGSKIRRVSLFERRFVINRNLW